MSRQRCLGAVCDRVGATDQRFAVVGDRLCEAGIVAIAVAQLAVERQPTGALGASRELAEDDGLAGPRGPVSDQFA